jgi:hypothetical protein
VSSLLPGRVGESRGLVGFIPLEQPGVGAAGRFLHGEVRELQAASHRRPRVAGGLPLLPRRLVQAVPDVISAVLTQVTSIGTLAVAIASWRDSRAHPAPVKIAAADRSVIITTQSADEVLTMLLISFRRSRIDHQIRIRDWAPRRQVTLARTTPSARLCQGGKPFGAMLRSRSVSLWNRR